MVHVQTPALREVPEDVPLLAAYFLNKYCQEMKKDPKHLSSHAQRTLQGHHWPGNVRELENEMKRLVVTARRSRISEQDLDDAIRSGNFASARNSSPSRLSLHQAVAELEQSLIQEALQQFKYNQVHTAKALGLSRQGLIKKMKRYGIENP